MSSLVSASTERNQDAPAARPLLTIAIPTYNRAAYLDRSFEHHLTAFNAAGIDFEIFVSDDCSPDNTAEIVAKWSERDRRVRAVRHSENLGPYGNFLHCYRQARGEFIVWVGDDDLLIPEAVLAHVERLKSDADIVMIQCPWILIDEVHDNREIGLFYRHDRDELFEVGEHKRCLDFLLNHHVFPEWFILRRDAAEQIVEMGTVHVYHYFAHLARALNHGKVLFSTRPYARVTAISKGDNAHTGNSLTMTGWDHYRGGIEYMASFANSEEGAGFSDDLLRRITDFTLTRMRVAVRLHVQSQNWGLAYHLDRRLRAYGQGALDEEVRPVVAGLAALEALVTEAEAQRRNLIVLDDIVTDQTIESLNAHARSRIIRRRDPRSQSPWPKAFALVSPVPDHIKGPNDIVLDLGAAFRRFPA